MTNKEAIEILKPLTEYSVDKNGIGTFPMVSTPLQAEALGLAIEALEEKPQGEWIFEEDIITFPGNYMKCSNCGMGAVFLEDGQFLSNYCHWCGAKMKDWYPKRGEEE
jgi:hypothetical protein